MSDFIDFSEVEARCYIEQAAILKSARQSGPAHPSSHAYGRCRAVWAISKVTLA
jgi:hypothetical protein